MRKWISLLMVLLFSSATGNVFVETQTAEDVKGKGLFHSYQEV
ncbi:hypothetical protein [Thermotalea metallivorans]|uniref:Uncharacterized protein n=1 Tax=Thermotalea metallivorans TaxID=520762 RepID=A0A140LDN6_9FIRM|nr:hypothetical protein [Thermotalea metallivorans]KXG78661.1 hypothetical protein AN619_01870 [Thermotalea metallivorans]